MATCIHCKNQINQGATICTHCAKLQSRLRSEIAFWSGVVGLLALVGSAYAFVTGFADKWIAQRFGVDFQIVSLSSYKTLNLMNTSEYDIFVRNLELTLPDGKTGFNYVLSDFAKSGDALTVDLGKTLVAQTDGPYKKIFSPCNYGGHFVSGDAALRKQVEDNALARDFNTHLPDMIATESDDYRFFAERRSGTDPKSLRRLDLSCSATLNYRVLGGRDIARDIPCVAIMRHRIEPTDACTAALAAPGEIDRDVAE